MPAAAPKLEPESLRLRARPRPVTRLNRRALMIVAGLGALLVFGAATLALRPPRALPKEPPKELYNTETKPLAAGFEALPKTYADAAKPPSSLSDALAHDAEPGAPLTDVYAGVGGTSESEHDAASPFRALPQDGARDAVLTEAKTAEAARGAGVFFPLAASSASARRNAAPGAESVGVAEASIGDPYAPRTAPFGGERDEDPNRQIRKLAFLDDRGSSETDNPHRLEEPATLFEVMAGTVIPASLVTGINSDLPGTVIAQVTENVRDSVTGQYVLIPQGARLLGRYDSVVAFGQRRALLVWSRIIYPGGASIVVDNLPASDVAGYSGLSDEVDFHTFRLLKGIALSTLLGVGTELSFDQSESDIVSALREAAQTAANQAGQKIVQRNLDIQPTLKIRPGWPVRVIVHKDLALRPVLAARRAP